MGAWVSFYQVGQAATHLEITTELAKIILAVDLAA